jgi:hypothetical protein
VLSSAGALLSSSSPLRQLANIYIVQRVLRAIDSLALVSVIGRSGILALAMGKRYWEAD